MGEGGQEGKGRRKKEGWARGREREEGTRESRKGLRGGDTW
jgi:hypothetical protein